MSPRQSKYTATTFWSGQKFGDWTVTNSQIFRDSKGRGSVECQCTCGEISRVDCGHLSNGASTRCAKCNKIHRNGSRNPNWHGGDFDKIPAYKLTQIRRLAEARGIEYNITPEYAFSVYQSQSGSCAITGLPLQLTQGVSYFNNSGTLTSSAMNNSTSTTITASSYNASLDRIDSTQGYVPGNIQWVVGKINLLKGRMPQQEFIQMCLSVANASNKQFNKG